MIRIVSNRSYLLLAAGSALVWLSAWVTGLCVDPGTWPVRYTLFGIGFLVSAHVALAWMWKLSSEHRAAAYYFEALGHFDTNDPDSNNDALLPSLRQDNPWYNTAHQLKDHLTDLHWRVQDAENDRTALEVRAKRTTALYEQAQSILDGLAEPVVAINNLNEVVLANRSAETLFEFDLNTTEQRAADKLLHCDALIDLLMETQHRTGATRRSGEVQLSEGKDDDQWYRATACGVPSLGDGCGEHDQVNGAVAVLRDINESKAIQKRHADFVSSVSHEMKSPLAGIKAYVELLADGDAKDEATSEEFLGIINSQTDRLQRLIDNLLNLARIEAGVVRVSKTPRSLNELLEEAISVNALTAESKQIELKVELSPMYLGVLVDRDLMLQAAINLLSNAVKYTPEGGTVSLRSRLRGNEVVFEVEDTGVGLSADDCERVFEKFYRVTKTHDMAEGTGLGLPLARHIVEDVHGGRLSVSSEVGAGSTFSVTLPSTGKLK